MTDETNLRERIAVVETENAEFRRQLSAIFEKLEEIHKDFTRAKGFTAGIVVTVSVIWGAIIAGWQFVKHKFGG